MPRTWNIVPGIAWKGGGLRNKRLEMKLSLKGHSKAASNSFFFALIRKKIGLKIKNSIYCGPCLMSNKKVISIASLDFFSDSKFFRNDNFHDFLLYNM